MPYLKSPCAGAPEISVPAPDGEALARSEPSWVCESIPRCRGIVELPEQVYLSLFVNTAKHWLPETKPTSSSLPREQGKFPKWINQGGAESARPWQAELC